jgi:flagella basal body P-ring formation protein FlgA
MIFFTASLVVGTLFFGGVLPDLSVDQKMSATLPGNLLGEPSATACHDDAVAPEPGVSTEVALTALVAERWGLPPRSVFFEWGPGEGTIPAEVACLRILGSGSGGIWVVEMEVGETRVRRRARFGHSEQRWIAAHDLPRDHTLGADDMRFEEERRWGPPRMIENPEPGWTTRRVIRAGQTLVAPSVVPPILVRIGSAVEVEIQRGAVMLRVTGETRTSGSLGDDVLVRLPSGKTVWGTVRPGPVVAIFPQQER